MKSVIYKVKAVVYILVCFILALLITGATQKYLLYPVCVSQTSMYDTLYDGDRLLVTPFTYYFTEPKRGDIVTFYRGEKEDKGIWDLLPVIFKSKEKSLVKRIVGIPGDYIKFDGGSVYINGELYEEPYVEGITYAGFSGDALTIPEGCYFMMGDNRIVSLDSRDFGLVDKASITGKVIFRVWPLNLTGGIE